MKNIVLGSALALAALTSLPVNAAGEQTFCSGGLAMTSTVTANAAADGTDFVKVPFTPKCSANVFLVGNDRSATLYTVGSASIKGKTQFGGSSAGGAVGNVGTCSGTPPLCAVGDATAGSDAAPQT